MDTCSRIEPHIAIKCGFKSWTTIFAYMNACFCVSSDIECSIIWTFRNTVTMNNTNYPYMLPTKCWFYQGQTIRKVCCCNQLIGGGRHGEFEKLRPRGEGWVVDLRGRNIYKWMKIKKPSIFLVSWILFLKKKNSKLQPPLPCARFYNIDDEDINTSVIFIEKCANIVVNM